MAGPFDLEALDLLPDAQGAVALHVRIGGPADVLPARLERLRGIVGAGEAQLDDHSLWHTAQEFTWAAPTAYLVKLPTTHQQLPALDAALHQARAARRYAVGGNLAWISWMGDPASLHQLLAAQGVRGLVLRAPTPIGPFIGAAAPSPMLARITTALDPDRRFPALPA
jgi:glycolate oxidase FAD binding subunit